MLENRSGGSPLRNSTKIEPNFNAHPNKYDDYQDSMLCDWGPFLGNDNEAVVKYFMKFKFQTLVVLLKDGGGEQMLLMSSHAVSTITQQYNHQYNRICDNLQWQIWKGGGGVVNRLRPPFYGLFFCSSHMRADLCYAQALTLAHPSPLSQVLDPPLIWSVIWIILTHSQCHKLT